MAVPQRTMALRSSVYYLAWRVRPNHPWRSEELESRWEAHRKYLSLLERGMEAYLETRRRSTVAQ